jgi:hypothetical protein
MMPAFRPIEAEPKQRAPTWRWYGRPQTVPMAPIETGVAEARSLASESEQAAPSHAIEDGDAHTPGEVIVTEPGMA